MSLLRALFGPRHGHIEPRARVEMLAGQTMGTRYSVRLALAGQADLGTIGRDVEAAVSAVDAQMSTWKPESDISRFNASPPGDWFAVAPDVAKVVALALEISAATDGAFDICVGGAVNHWGFGPRGSATPPPGDEPASLTSYRDIEVRLSPPALRKLAPAYLDLSGIAKGFGVDAIAQVLLGYGVADYIVDIDGEVRASGRKPDGGSWMVGIERPDTRARGVQQVVALDTIAMATSGDYRRFFEIDGERYSHTIDPRTGRPTTSAVTLVSVADPHCARADALATALLVMGGDKGPAFANRNRIDALFLIRDDGGLIEKTTWQFDRFL